MSRRREAAEFAFALELSAQAQANPLTKPLPPLTPSTTPAQPVSSDPLGKSDLEGRQVMVGHASGRWADVEEEDEDEDEDGIVADSEEEREGGVPGLSLRPVSEARDEEEVREEEEQEEAEVPELRQDVRPIPSSRATVPGTHLLSKPTVIGERGGSGGGLLNLRTMSGNAEQKDGIRAGGGRDAKSGRVCAMDLPSIPSHSTIQTFTPSSINFLPSVPTDNSTPEATDEILPFTSRSRSRTRSRSPFRPGAVPIVLPAPGGSSHPMFSHGPGTGAEGLSTRSTGPNCVAGINSPIQAFTATGSTGRTGGAIGADAERDVSSGAARGADEMVRPNSKPRIRITSKARMDAESRAGAEDHPENGSASTGTTGPALVATGSTLPIVSFSLNTADLPSTAMDATQHPPNPTAIDLDARPSPHVNASAALPEPQRKKPVMTYGSKKGKEKPGITTIPRIRPEKKKRRLLASQDVGDSDSEGWHVHKIDVDAEDEVVDRVTVPGPSRSKHSPIPSSFSCGGATNKVELASEHEDLRSTSAKPPVRPARKRSKARARDSSPDPLDAADSESEDGFVGYPVARKPALAGSVPDRTASIGRRGGTSTGAAAVMELEVEVPSSRTKNHGLVTASRKMKHGKKRVAISSGSEAETDPRGGDKPTVTEDGLVTPIAGVDEIGPVAGPSKMRPSSSDPPRVPDDEGSGHVETDVLSEDEFVPDAPAKRGKLAGKGKIARQAAPKKRPATSRANGGKKGSKGSTPAKEVIATAAPSEVPSTRTSACKGKAQTTAMHERSEEFVGESDAETDEVVAVPNLPKQSLRAPTRSTDSAMLQGKHAACEKASLAPTARADAMDVDEAGCTGSLRSTASPSPTVGKAKKPGKRVPESDEETRIQLAPKKANGMHGKDGARELSMESESDGENARRSKKEPRENSPAAALHPRAAFKLNRPDRPTAPSVVVDKHGNVKEFKTDRTDLPRVVSGTGGVKRMGMSRKNHIPSLHRNIKLPPKKLGAAPKKPERVSKEGNYGSDEEPMDAFGRPIIGPDHADYWKMED